MKRELLIAAGVLVPFGVLVALGFYFSSPTPAPPEPGAIPVSVPRAPLAAPAPRGDAGLVAPAPAPTPAPPTWPKALAAPLAAVAPEVHRCFDDERARLKEAVTTRVRFTPLPDGGFGGVTVETSARDPWLGACVEDVFQEVGFVPSGAETFEPAEHTFSFDPSGD